MTDSPKLPTAPAAGSPPLHGGGKRLDIQGLRAIAVGLVILAHTGLDLAEGGFIGVDVFFVISGYLITSVILREASKTGRVSIRDFYARRARRILPAATTVLFAVVVYTAFTEPLTRIQEVARDALWSSFFLANVRFAQQGTDYWASPDPSPFQHYWSLAVEEQFYLLWPLLVGLAAARWTRNRLAAAGTALAVLSLGWAVHVTAVNPVGAYFSSPARAYELAIGGVVAVLAPAIARLGRRTRWTLQMGGAVALVAAALAMDSGTPFPGWQALLPVLATAALLAAGDGTRSPVERILRLRPMQYLGDISFSLYLWHWPVLILGRQALPDDWSRYVSTAVLLALTLALSSLSYHFVEQPFLRGRTPGWRFAVRSLALWPASLATVLAVTVAATAYGQVVLEQNLAEADSYFQANPDALGDPTVRTLEEDLASAVAWARDGAPVPPSIDFEKLKDDVWQRKYPCVAWWDQSTTKICPQGDVEAESTVVLYGDSHAGVWLPALDKLGQLKHYRVIPLLKPGCGPYDLPQGGAMMTDEVCYAFQEWALDQIEAIDPDAIILAGRGLRVARNSERAAAKETWLAAVRSSLETITGLAPVVKVIGDVPSRPEEAAPCLQSLGNRQVDCLAPRESDETRSNAWTIEAVEGTAASYVSAVDLVCSGDTCPLVVGSDVVYFDDDHLTVTWVRLIAPRFGALLGPLTEAPAPTGS